MSNSKNVAAILGPTIAAMVASEFPLVQPHLYDSQIPPVGWFFLLLGLFRMFAAGAYQRGSARASATTFMILEGTLGVLGLIMTYHAYRRDKA